MTKEHLKQALVSIIIGASVAFLTVLIEGLADFVRSNGEHVMAGLVSTAYYLAKAYRV